jgi:hypothetical protein
MRVFPLKVVARCIELGINLVLGERAQSTETKVVYEDGQERPEVVVTTSKGRVIEGDMIVRRMGLASTKCLLITLDIFPGAYSYSVPANDPTPPSLLPSFLTPSQLSTTVFPSAEQCNFRHHQSQKTPHQRSLKTELKTASSQ